MIFNKATPVRKLINCDVKCIVPTRKGETVHKLQYETCFLGYKDICKNTRQKVVKFRLT